MNNINGVILPIFRKNDHFRKNDKIFFLLDEKLEKGIVDYEFENYYFSVKSECDKRRFLFSVITPFVLLEKEFFLLMEKQEYWNKWWRRLSPDFSIKYEDNILGFLNLNIENELKI